jgi:ZIP family zinc transporter
LNEWLQIFLLTLMAGIAMPIGAAIACVERIRPKWLENEFRHGVLAFGGGALLAAVALVLVPEGIRELPVPWVVCCFVSGAVALLLTDKYLSRRATPASQLVAMLSDFVPEAIALGATFASSKAAGLLLAGIIGLQNLPEGFNAYRELAATRRFRPLQTIGAFALMACLGPFCGILGYAFLAEYPQVISGIMLFAAGGILYLIFQDIAPEVRLENQWAPPLGAVAGFLIGLVGKMLTDA